jgi:hypothetical protein
MALSTPTSFFYSYKLELMEALSEKKQRNMVMAMMERNTF